MLQEPNMIGNPAAKWEVFSVNWCIIYDILYIIHTVGTSGNPKISEHGDILSWVLGDTRTIKFSPCAYYGWGQPGQPQVTYRNIVWREIQLASWNQNFCHHRQNDSMADTIWRPMCAHVRTRKTFVVLVFRCHPEVHGRMIYTTIGSSKEFTMRSSSRSKGYLNLTTRYGSVQTGKKNTTAIFNRSFLMFDMMMNHISSGFLEAPRAPKGAPTRTCATATPWQAKPSPLLSDWDHHGTTIRTIRQKPMVGFWDCKGQ